MDNQRRMKMYIDEEIIYELKEQYDITYVEGLEHNKDVQTAIGTIWEQRMEGGNLGSLSIGGDSTPAADLEDY